MTDFQELRQEVQGQGKRLDTMAEILATISAELREMRIALERLPSEISRLIKEQVAKETKPDLLARAYHWLLTNLS